LAKLTRNDFEIIYKTGASNRVTDALSWKMEDEEVGEADLGVITKPF